MTANATVDRETLDSLVAAFEAATVPLEQFHHTEHMQVALWYLADRTAEQALECMRGGLRRLLERHGKREGYDEAVTRFWMDTLRERLALTDPQAALEVRVAEVIAGVKRDRTLFPIRASAS
jgi:hypothetical protein